MAREKDYFSHVDAGRPVLEGHRRHKKKILNPFSSLPSQKFVNTKSDIFPELLWIALLFEKFGYHAGLKLARPLRESLHLLDPERPWFLLSEIATLSPDEWIRLEIEHDARTSIEAAFQPLRLYPELSLAFLTGDAQPKEALVHSLKKAVHTYSNRFETGGAAVLGIYVFLEALVGRLSMPREILSRITKIVDDPESADAEMAASSVRAITLTMFGLEEARNATWCRDFWLRNRLISACEDMNGRG